MGKLITLRFVASGDRRRYGTGSIRNRGTKNDPNYFIGWRGPDGKQQWSHVGHSYAAAEYALQEKVMAKMEGRTESLRGVKFKDLANDWLSRKQQGVAVKTYELYESIIRCHLIPALGEQYLQDITPDLLEEYRDDKLKGTAPVAGKKTKKQAAKKSVKHHLNVLEQIFWLARRRKLVTENPAISKFVARPEIKKPKAPLHFEVKEAERILENMGHYQAEGIVMISLGLREGELFGMPITAVDLDKNCLKVEQTLKREAGKLVISGYGKTDASERAIYFGDDLAEVFKRQIKKVNGGPDPDKLGLLFPNKVGKPQNASNFRNRVFLPACEKAGLYDPEDKSSKKPKIHGFRHSLATQLIGNGVPLPEVADMLGHASADTTARQYAGVLEDAKKSAKDLGATYAPKSAPEPEPEEEDEKKPEPKPVKPSLTLGQLVSRPRVPKPPLEP